jgi:hypothetical protein
LRSLERGTISAKASADLLFRVCGLSESFPRRDDSGQIIAMSCLCLNRVRVAADENTGIREPKSS